jgi:hypothetical protein
MNPHAVHRKQLLVQRQTVESQRVDSCVIGEVSPMVGYRQIQVGKFSFFNNAAYRGSWRRLFNRGSTFTPISPELR